jgi:hypothetical protein
MAALLSLAACSKSKPPESIPVGGVKLDLPKFQQVFAINADLQTSVSKVAMCIRYQQYAECLKELETMASYPNVTAEQKQVLAEFTEQVKQLKANPPAQ